MIENGTLLQNRYLIGEQIGAGGMGAVYRAVDQRFDNFVAIKETFYTDDELAVAFEREARLLNSLQHPVLPHVTDYFAENNGYFLVMQFIEGEDFSDILKREGSFASADLVRWANSLLDALDYLHSQNPPIIHRDIKPHNLKLTTRGDIILLDFGLAKLYSGEATAAVSVFGYSRTYSPLEQIQGTGTDARSDIFALGATAYHLLTGNPAVDALTRAAAIIAGKPDPLLLASEIKPEIPVGVATVIHSALALNPDQRFASARAMRQALEHAVNEIASDEVEDAPKEVAAVVAPIVPVVNSAETEKFPALEAFAEVVNPPQIEIVPDPPVVEFSTPQIVTPAPKPVLYSTTVAEAPTEVSSPRKAPIQRNSRKPLAALAAALICGILAIFYFTAGANSTGESNQNPVVQTASAYEEKTKEKTGDEIKSPPTNEAVIQTKPKSSAGETNAQKRKNAEPSDEELLTEQNTEEDTQAVSQPPEVPRTAPPPPVKTTRRSSQPKQQESEERSPVIEDEPVSDIESIFTGQSSEEGDNNERREQRRGRKNQISDEEREQRRERRQRRRERQNSQPFPPF